MNDAAVWVQFSGPALPAKDAVEICKKYSFGILWTGVLFRVARLLLDQIDRKLHCARSNRSY
jgi:hypothetical protein